VAPQHAKLPVYERELISLVKTVRNWRPYLWGRPFTVCTDHWSLKYILDQRLTTIPQHTWVSKLFGHDITVEYRLGKQNAAADALSHRDEEVLAVHAVSIPRVTPSIPFHNHNCSCAPLSVLRGGLAVSLVLSFQFNLTNMLLVF